MIKKISRASKKESNKENNTTRKKAKSQALENKRSSLTVMEERGSKSNVESPPKPLDNVTHPTNNIPIQSAPQQK